jgi:hypothetical protein
VFVRVTAVERRYELDGLRRSLMMLSPGVPGLTREAAIRLVEELCDVEERLDRLVAGLHHLLDQADPHAGGCAENRRRSGPDWP